MVLKAHREVEDPAWQLYDEAFREKMAAIGEKKWPGVDVQVYQETCGGYPQRRVERGVGGQGQKRSIEAKKPTVCWQFNNEGMCSYGKNCRFAHVCEVCRGAHARCHCPSSKAPAKHQRIS